MKYEFEKYQSVVQNKSVTVFVVKNASTGASVCRFIAESNEIAELNVVAAGLLLSDFTGKEDIKEIFSNYIDTYDLPSVLL